MPLVAIEEVLVNDSSQPNGCEERANDTNHVSSSEALDWTCTEVVEDYTSDERSDVGVEDGRECVAITSCNSVLQCLAALQLFLDTLVDEHVGIDRSTESQYHTGNTTHGEGCLEGGEDTECEEEVEEEGTVSHHTSLETVHQAHVNHQDDECDDEADETGADGFSTEAWTYDVFLNNLCRSWHLTRAEHVGKVLGIVGCEVTSNLAASTVNLIIYIRCAIYETIEHDCDSVVNVCFSEGNPLTCTFRIHLHADAWVTELVEVVL